MPDPDLTQIPQLAWPLQFDATGTGYATVQQDSLDELRANVGVICSFPLGYRIEAPEYGIRQHEFEQRPLDTDDILEALETYEPRATIDVVELPYDPSDPTAAQLRVEVSMADADPDTDEPEEGLMAEYLELDLVADPDALAETSFDYLTAAINGFQARPGNIITVLIEADAQMGAEVIEQVSEVPPAIFAYFGQAFLGVARRTGVASTGTAQITFAPDVEATLIEAEWMINVPNPSIGGSVIFTTDIDIEAPDGGGTVNVPITAADPGINSNGSFGTCDQIEVIDGVELVYVEIPTAGGTDDESEEDYLDRLANATSILAPRPILPQDFAALAQQVPGVGRTTALDLYQAGTNDDPVASSSLPGGSSSPIAAGPGVYGVERCVTTVITDAQNMPPSPQLKQAVYDLLDSSREVNFWVYVIGPSTSVIDITVTVMAYPNVLPVDVQAQVVAALTSWLSVENWGVPAGAAGAQAPEWLNDTTIRVNEVIEHANRATGVWYVPSATELGSQPVLIGVGGGAGAAEDVTLTGAAPMPLVGTITVTVLTPEPPS